MGLFQWKGAKPIPPVSDDEFEAVRGRFSEFLSGDSRSEDAEIAAISLLAFKIGEGFTPEVYRMLLADADAIAALLANEAFLPLTADETLTLILIHFTAFMDEMGFESPSMYDIENVLSMLVMQSLVLAQAGRGLPAPSKEEIDSLRVLVGSYLAASRSVLPREHASALLNTLAVASMNHAQAVRTFTGGAESLDPQTAVRVA